MSNQRFLCPTCARAPVAAEPLPNNPDALWGGMLPWPPLDGPLPTGYRYWCLQGHAWTLPLPTAVVTDEDEL